MADYSVRPAEWSDKVASILTNPFREKYPQYAHLAETDKVQNWLGVAAKEVVEFEGLLPHETKKQSDRRKECHKAAYEGDIKNLVNCLRNTYIDSRSVSSPMLLLNVFSGISSINDVVNGEQEQPQTQTPTMSEQPSEQTEETTVTNTANSNISDTAEGGKELSPIDMTEPKLDVEDEEELVLPAHNANPEIETVEADVVNVSERVETDAKEVEVKTEVGHRDSTETVKDDDRVEITTGVESVVSQPAQEDKTLVEVKPERTESRAPQVEDSYQKTEELHPTHAENPRSPEAEVPKNIVKQEEKKIMPDLNEMAKLAAEKMNGGTPVEGGTATARPSRGKKSEERIAAEEQAKLTIAERMQSNNAYVQNTLVTAIITPVVPKYDRIIDKSSPAGKLVSPTKDKTGEMLVKEKLNKFIKAATGNSNMSLEQFEAATDDVRYAAVPDVDYKGYSNKARAKACYQLLKTALQNPDADYAASPQAPTTVPVRGYCVGGKNINRNEMIITLLDKTNGALYAPGQLDAEGKTTEEKPIMWQVATVRIQSSSQSASGLQKSSQKAAKKFSISAKRQKDFMNDPAHIKYLMSVIDEENTARGSFKAAIEVQGTAVPAMFQYEVPKTKDGKAEIDETTHQPKMTKRAFSINVVLAVKDVKHVVADEFKSDQVKLNAQIDAYWGTNLEQSDSNKSNAAATSSKNTAIFKVLADFYEMGISTKGVEGSELLAKITADKKAQENAALASETSELDQ